MTTASTTAARTSSIPRVSSATSGRTPYLNPINLMANSVLPTPDPTPAAYYAFRVVQHQSNLINLKGTILAGIIIVAVTALLLLLFFLLFVYNRLRNPQSDPEESKDDIPMDEIRHDQQGKRSDKAGQKLDWKPGTKRQPWQRGGTSSEERSETSEESNEGSHTTCKEDQAPEESQEKVNPLSADFPAGVFLSADYTRNVQKEAADRKRQNKMRQIGQDYSSYLRREFDASSAETHASSARAHERKK